MTPHDYGSSIDTTVTALADEQRRLIIHHLTEDPDGTATFEELKDYIATHSAHGISPEKAAIQLHHAHLPQLADAGIIEYDTQRKTTQYDSNPVIEKILASITAVSTDASDD